MGVVNEEEIVWEGRSMKWFRGVGIRSILPVMGLGKNNKNYTNSTNYRVGCSPC